MAYTPAQARQAIATKLTALAGWDESSLPYDLFGAAPDDQKTQTFAVGMGEIDAIDDRQKTGDGIRVRSRVNVAYARRMTPKDKRASLDAAMNEGRALVKQVMTGGASWPAGFEAPIFVSIVGGIQPGGDWFLGDVAFDFTFRMDVTS